MVEGIGPIRARTLLRHVGSAEAVFKEPAKHLLKVPEIGKIQVERIKSADVLQRAERELLWADAEGVRVIHFQDEAYPYRLKQCYDFPLIIYMRGEVNLNMRRTLAIVGTRSITPYGREQVHKLIDDLRGSGVLIVSGLAYGIDVAAHAAALENDLPTVGVVAHGLDRIYPAAHRHIARKMEQSGGVLSEFMSETIPDKENFPQRNRLIAGLCDGIVVAESKIHGGAIITANFAFSYNRELFAFPGRIGDPMSAGCNMLIRTQKAQMAESLRDIERALNWDIPPGKEKPLQTMLPILTDEEEKVFNIITEAGKITADPIAEKSGLPVSSIATVLLNLELNGLIRSLPGRTYAAR
jgi:DNA processing protein